MAMLRLLPIAPAELRLLARGVAPAWPGLTVLDGALPPDRVALRALQHLATGKPSHWCATFCMVAPAGRVIVGSCGFKDVPQRGRVEIGYGVAPVAQRQGHASAAVAELLRLATLSGEVVAVLAQVSADNPASTRVVQRLGFLPRGERLDLEGEMLVQWVRALAA
jgi:RimJ/RimL family protein N-acetyltransferase